MSSLQDFYKVRREHARLMYCPAGYALLDIMKFQQLFHEKGVVIMMSIVCLCCIFTSLHTIYCQELLFTSVFYPSCAGKDVR